MTPITSLPAELLITIFNYLDKITDAADCRLVCRAWNDPAERAMFEHGVTISTALQNETKMQSLFNVLIKDQQNRKYWIKHLKLDIDTAVLSNLTNELIMLSMNQNINTISGVVYDLELVDRITNLISNSDEGIDQIRELRLRNKADFSTPQNLALTCKKTLETLEVMNLRGISSPLVPRLNEFTRLTSLMLALRVMPIDTLEKALNDCQHLQKLEWTARQWKGNSDSVPGWNQQHIKIHPNLKSLKTVHYRKCPSNLFEYMLHKFVNLNSISITLCTKMDPIDDDDFGRILAMIKKVPQREIICLDQQDAKDIMQLMNEYENINMEKLKVSKQFRPSIKITF